MTSTQQRAELQRQIWQIRDDDVGEGHEFDTKCTR